MGILTAFLRWLGLRRTRKVAQLAPYAEGEVDLVEEVVETAPVPLKPQHLRLTHRDPRLLPKPKPVVRRAIGVRVKRKRYLDTKEAARLFAPTLRTRERNLRDLAPDEAQLARYALPVWRTEFDIAAALGIDVRRLRYFTIHEARERTPHYVTFAIPKRRGGERLIMAPKRELKALQRKLNALLVDRLPVSEFAHGFRRARSVATNAAPHVGKRVVVRMDLADFFPSLHVGRVRGLLVALGYGYPVATVLATLMTEAPRQPVVVGEARFFPPVASRACPQGAPTSPGLSNAIVVKMDRRLAGLARKLGFAYTRYADDLVFSGDDPAQVQALLHWVHRVVREEGFAVNREKTLVMHAGRSQRVTGVVVNRVLGLSRTSRRLLRAALHRLAQAEAAGRAQAGERRRLNGKLGYLAMLNREQAARLARR